MVQGLAGELTRFIDGDIAGRLAREEITPTQARALNELSRFTGTAIRTAANPNDPMNAFAQEYLGQLLGPGGAGTTGGSGTPAVDPETQQQITWIRDAIDQGHTDTAADLINGMVEQRMQANPEQSRADVTARLMATLGIQPSPDTLSIGPDGRVAVGARLVISGGNDMDSDEAAYELRIRAEIERFRAIAPGQSEQTLRAYAEQALQIRDDVKGISGLRNDLTDNEVRQIALGLKTDRERLQEYADRLAAIPEDQRVFELQNSRNEIAQQIGRRLNDVLGVVPAPGVEPVTQQQLLRMADVALGILPITGEASSFYELIYGRSPASQEEASRLWAAFGVVTAGYGRLGGRLMSAEQRAARELEYAGGESGRWTRKPAGRQDAGSTLATELGKPPAGMLNPEAHHIGGFARADLDTQVVLNRFGITPNSVENGIWLSAEQHALTKGNDYKEWVAAQIRDITSRPDAIAALDRIKDTLRNLKPGTTPPWRAGK